MSRLSWTICQCITRSKFKAVEDKPRCELEAGILHIVSVYIYLRMLQVYLYNISPLETRNNLEGTGVLQIHVGFGIGEIPVSMIEMARNPLPVFRAGG